MSRRVPTVMELLDLGAAASPAAGLWRAVGSGLEEPGSRRARILAIVLSVVTLTGAVILYSVPLHWTRITAIWAGYVILGTVGVLAWVRARTRGLERPAPAEGWARRSLAALPGGGGLRVVSFQRDSAAMQVAFEGSAEHFRDLLGQRLGAELDLAVEAMDMSHLLIALPASPKPGGEMQENALGN